MNSLYGRFGLNPEGIEVVITTEDKADKIVENENYVKITPLLSGNVMVSYEKSEDDFTNINISVPISSAIAGYSRITMSHYFTKYSKHLLYVDTDGIKLDTKLEECEVDNKKLGKMKYEYTLKEFVGLGPKAYGGIISTTTSQKDNNENRFEEIVKLKGYGSTLHFDEFKKGLNRDNKIELQQKK
ncbi:hypothetical protein F4823DRAFT_621215 [Ustulina deusta]|nr:hypothetical protein F4823DRAFT_621215 [Ustulina deusta]